MTEAIKAQLRAAGVAVPGEPAPKRRATAAAPAAVTTEPTHTPSVQQARNSAAKTGITAPPIQPAVVPLRWEVAKGLYAEQHPGTFRVVVVGPHHQLPELLRALQGLGDGGGG